MKQYRLIEPGEYLREGDEFKGVFEWIKTTYAGSKVPHDSSTLYRREIIHPICPIIGDVLLLKDGRLVEFLAMSYQHPKMCFVCRCDCGCCHERIGNIFENLGTL